MKLQIGCYDFYFFKYLQKKGKNFNTGLEHQKFHASIQIIKKKMH